jgi:hypothetical protein
MSLVGTHTLKRRLKRLKQEEGLLNIGNQSLKVTVRLFQQEERKEGL